MTEVTSQKENKINIKTQSKFMTMPDKSCLSSKSRSTTGFHTNRASQEEKKIRFEDDTEETKYRVYLKHVNMLNQMKQYLASMHKSMSKEVIKKLVVSIKKMEQEIVFHENNWHLFKSPNLDEVDISENYVDEKQGSGKKFV